MTFFAVSQKKDVQSKWEPGSSFSISVERGMMILDSLPVRVRVAAQELLFLLLLALCGCFMLHYTAGRS